jgi:SAM-dependent methyltransferase
VLLRVRASSFVTGLRGLALLRRWPYGDAARRFEENASGAPGSQSDTGDFLDIEQMDVDPGYEQWAVTYDTLPNPLLAAEQPAMTRLLQRFAVGRALDAASGTGRYASFLDALGHDVVAVDTSRAMVEQARSPDIPVLIGDLYALPIRDESIDLTVCALALTHLEDLRAPIAELARVTRAGGHVVVSDIHPVSVALGGQALFRDAENRLRVVRNHEHWHSDYVRAFGEAGLHIRDCLEPRVSEEVIALLGEPMRDAFRDACLGLPYALIWDTVKAP